MPRRLLILEGRLALCRLGPSDEVPAWASRGDWSSITRTADELSIACRESAVPPEVEASRGWRALRVAGAMDLAEVGVLAGLSGAIAGAGVALFALSTFDTDYLLVKEPDLGRAIDALRASGHAVDPPG